MKMGPIFEQMIDYFNIISIMLFYISLIGSFGRNHYIQSPVSHISGSSEVWMRFLIRVGETS